MIFLDDPAIEQLFSYQEFVPLLKEFLTHEVAVPDRSHFSVPVPGSEEATLLTMPSWVVGEYMGVKIVSVFPGNQDLPSIQGVYLLMSAQTGEILATMDGAALTRKRTAAVSALASSLLSLPTTHNMLMVGTGTLCYELIQAHASVRPLERVEIWGRNGAKAAAKAGGLGIPGVYISSTQDLARSCTQADLISVATLSDRPLVYGEWLGSQAYLDLVGSYKPHTREADDACLRGANMIVDTTRALTESGDLAIPLAEGVISEADILSDLSTLCREGVPTMDASRIVFKSVGFAAPDLAAAVYLYQKSKTHD
ncbi:MAG TPA: ornithine cyclodeaminase family protein [Cytophagales bacterium]|nr:ornithine cyclodeaminase family protein [Cytophagales bacterium]HAP62209.1 ornithine cyclodeaminase family protein [Cytophagales bacterium]